MNHIVLLLKYLKLYSFEVLKIISYICTLKINVLWNYLRDKASQSLLNALKTDLDCEEYLASIKWEKRYCCRKCGHTKYQVRKDFSRTCNICGDTESPTAGTLFHRLKIGLRKAFFICFEMTTTTKGLSASQVARRYEISRQTAHYFI